MTFWDDLWSQLKNVEGLLHCKDLRRRYINTCIVGSAVDTTEAVGKLMSWSGSLYEKRWGCVRKFLDALMKILPLLRRTWSEQNWRSNTDSRGANLKARDDDGGAAFNPVQFSETLVSPLFRIRVCLVLGVQGVVEQLASWSEACPCHEAWFKTLSVQHQEMG